MSTVTKKMDLESILKLKENLKDAKVCKTPPYAIYQIKTSEVTITAYESLKVVFQGEGANFYGEASKSSSSNKNIFPSIGSDEVGTGDFFGPVVVCATLVTEKDLELMNKLKIQDSKQLSDKDIQKIAPLLMQNIKYSLLILDNKKYNEVHLTNNMNAIKAKLHNQAINLLLNKINIKPNQIVIDQFTPPKSYFNYLKNEQTVVKDITFETKAENKYLAVACGSIIARYSFIKKMDEMSKQYDFDFPKGAGSKVDEAGKEFINQYSVEKLEEVSKTHFKNMEKIVA